MENKRDRAIVIGGSMAGLLAARVLAKHFTKVIILDRDTFPESPDHRRGVPQGRHTHGLLASGRRVLESFFPGIGQELLDAGAQPADIIGDTKWFLAGGLSAKFTSGLDGLLLSRPLLEYSVRKRVFGLPNVSVRSGVVVTGLHASGDRSAVTGVRCDGEAITADLVVDASGRASSALDWLDLLGYEKPIEERIEIGVGYTTRLFRRRPSDTDGDAGVVIPATPEATKGGVMLAQEGDRWTVTLFSYFRDYAPADLGGFREYARKLPYQEIYNVIRDAEPIGEAQVARFPASLRRRYEHLKGFPEGFLVFGDAICSFNPTFGQGMSTAALEAVELDETLSGGSLSGIAPRFFKRAARVVDIPWSVSVGADLGLPCTKGPRPFSVKVINWYIGKLHKASHTDSEAALAFHRVANLLAAPASILHPRIVMRVIKANLWGGRVRAAEPVAQEV